jgi:Mn-dependent DtxR family transcriptional regulator
MEYEDLEITPEEAEEALRESVRLGYRKRNSDGNVIMTDAGMRRVIGMVRP